MNNELFNQDWFSEVATKAHALLEASKQEKKPIDIKYLGVNAANKPMVNQLSWHPDIRDERGLIKKNQTLKTASELFNPDDRIHSAIANSSEGLIVDSSEQGLDSIEL